MSRYIDADELKGALQHYKDTEDSLYYDELEMYIDDTHTADVKEVRHGEWRLIEEDVDGNGNNQYRCSLCEAGELHAPFVIVPYCWKCGAKMDKEKEEE